MIRTSTLAASVKPSATIAAGTKARQLKAAGIKVYDFSLGEPDFNTPKHICDAAAQAALAGQTHYTPTSGTAEVKAAICKWYKSFHGLDCTPENVIVCPPGISMLNEIRLPSTVPVSAIEPM